MISDSEDSSGKCSAEDKEPPVTGLIGATISGVTLPVGTISSARKVPQISPSATASPLSNKEILHIQVAVVSPQ